MDEKKKIVEEFVKNQYLLFNGVVDKHEIEVKKSFEIIKKDIAAESVKLEKSLNDLFPRIFNT